MVALFETRRDLVFITVDLGYMALEGVAKAYGERFVNAGVAEQNAVSLAAGLAREGHLPWVYSMATFTVLRPYEQIRDNVCLHELPVKLVGNGGGYGYGIMGATHHALEDVGAMRALPNMRIYVPLVAADVASSREQDGRRSSAQLLTVERARRDPRSDTRLRAVAQAQVRSKRGRHRQWAPSCRACTRWASPELLDELEIWSVGTFPIEDIPAELSASIEEKRRVITIEEHYRACGLGEALSYLFLTSGVVPRFPDLSARRRISFRALRQPTLAPGGERACGSSVGCRAWRSSSVPEPMLSAVITCYKDAQAIPPMHQRLTDVFGSLGVSYEIIFVNDGEPGRRRLGVEGADGQGRRTCSRSSIRETSARRARS